MPQNGQSHALREARTQAAIAAHQRGLYGSILALATAFGACKKTLYNRINGKTKPPALAHTHQQRIP
jgi:hypothetical protein